MSGTTGVSGFALISDPYGTVREIVRDDIGLPAEFRVGAALATLFSLAGAKNGAALLAAIAGSELYSWKGELPIAGRSAVIYFRAFQTTNSLLIAGAPADEDLDRLCNSLAASTPDTPWLQLTAPLTYQTQSPAAPEPEDALYDEISRINNELVNAQREVARKNAALERTNAALWKTQVDLRSAQEVFSTSFHASPYGLLIVRDRDGQVIDANKHYLLMSGRTHEEVVLHPAHELCLYSDMPAPFATAGGTAALPSASQKGRLRDLPLQLRNGQGEARDILLTEEPVEIAGEECRLVILQDVTERLRLEEERRAREVAELASRARSEFLSRMSHELRTPLNAILGFAQLLSMGALDEEEQDSTERILFAGYHLLDLVNHVLDIDQATQGTLELQIIPVATGALIDSCLASFSALAAEQKVSLEASATAPASGEPLEVLADPQRLRQALDNLVTNAIDYNMPGGKVSVTCTSDTHSQQVSIPVLGPGRDARVTITVRDTGQGIAPEKMERLFAPFERLDPEHGPPDGVGLGLVLAKVLVEAMGGTLDVRSVQGEGSSFAISLPAAQHELSQVKGGVAQPTLPLKGTLLEEGLFEE